MNEDTIKRLKDNPDFVAFQKIILAKIDKLDTVQVYKELSNERMGEEMRVRAKAINVLKSMLLPFIDFREKKAVTQNQLHKQEEKYGL